MSDQPPGPDWWLGTDGNWYPPSTAPVASPPDPKVDPLAGWLLTGGSAAVVLGSFLPWATITGPFGTLSRPGTDGDGLLTLIGGAIAGALGIALLRGSNKRSLAIASLVLSGLVLVVAFIDTASVSSLVADVRSGLAYASVGVGLWITDLGALVAVAGSILWLRLSIAGNRS